MKTLPFWRRHSLHITALLLVLVFWVGSALRSRPPAPEIDWQPLSGPAFSSQDLRGRPYLVQFWSITCSACLTEMPHLINLYRRWHAQGLELIAVALQGDSPRQVQQYAQTHALPFPVVLDQGSIAEQFGQIELTPSMFLINRQGQLEKYYLGIPNFTQLEQTIARALGQTLPSVAS